MVKKPFNKAFTLAEVLITLTVIGVVAALTIPVLMNYAFEREAASKAKETYSILTQAITSWQVSKDCVGDSKACLQSGGYNAYVSAQVVTEWLSLLKVQESKCYANTATIATVPWIANKVAPMSVSSPSSGVMDKTGNYDGGCAVLLQNGATFTLTTDLGGGTVVAFDINAQRKPNRIGKDVFLFSLFNGQNKNVNPYYINAWGGWCNGQYIEGLCNSCSYTCAPDEHSPLAYILTHDKLPNMKVLGYPSLP